MVNTLVVDIDDIKTVGMISAVLHAYIENRIILAKEWANDKQISLSEDEKLDSEGYLLLSKKEICDNLGLSYVRQKSALTTLVNNGSVKVKRTKTTPVRIAYKIK